MFAALSTGSANLGNVVNPIINLINSILPYALGLVGAIGALYCVLLGVKFAKAEEPQEHEKAKNHLKNAIIGFVLIFVLLFALKIGSDVMLNWYQDTAAAVATTSGTVSVG